MDKGYLILRHPASDELFLNVVVNAETFTGRREVAEQNLCQAVRFCVLPNLKHVVHTAVDLRPWLVWQQRVNYALVESELAAIVGDSEHIVHAWVNLPGMDFRSALGKFFYERLLYLRGLRHFVVVNDLRFWQIQLIGSFNVCHLLKDAHKLGQIKELAKPRPRPIARPLRSQLHRRHCLSEVRRPCVEMVHSELVECVVL